jgi:GNAT superfamily N-acetyltransferase
VAGGDDSCLKRTRTSGTLKRVTAPAAGEWSFVQAFSDYTLAKRLELFASADVRGFAEAAAVLYPDSGACFIKVGGGIAGYVGAKSPANGAIGLGFDGEVTDGQIATVERFFLDRGEEPIVSVCPLSHPSLIQVLSARGWHVGTFENVLVRRIDPAERFDAAASGVEIREAQGESELDAWALLAARGFSAPDDPTPADRRLARAATRREGTRFLVGMIDGTDAGTGQLEIAGELGWLSADTTLPAFRRRGVQSSLQRFRLAMARDAGCALAVTESVPGSPSQRNMERLGFQVAYTRADARYPAPSRVRPQKGTIV